MSKFSDEWSKERDQSLVEKLKERLRSSEPIKVRIGEASRQIQAQILRLETATTRLRARDETIFADVVASLEKHDAQHAAMYANELTEVRKTGRMVVQAKLALEQIVMRLQTITDLGEIVVTLAPAVRIIKGVKQGLAGAIPEAEGEISEISGLLSSILVEAGTVGGYSVNFEVANEEAEKALAEAAAVAESSMKEKLPEVPAGVSEAEESDEGLAT